MLQKGSHGRRLAIYLVFGLSLAALALGGVPMGTTASATELRFVVADLAKDRAIWHPNFMFINLTTDLKEGLVLILENPTNNLHSFVVEDLFEQIPMTIREMVAPGKEVEVRTYELHPIRVIVPPKETKRVRVNTVLLLKSTTREQRFRFFCHLHESEHLGGMILVTR